MMGKNVESQNDLRIKTVILYSKLMLESNYGASQIKKNLIQIMTIMDINVFSFYITPTNVMLINKKTGDVKMVSVENSSYDFDKMGQVKLAVNKFNAGQLSLNQLYESFEEIETQKESFPIYTQVFFAGLMCGAMNLLISKTGKDVLLAGVVSLVCYFFYIIFDKYINIKNFSVFLYSLLVSAIAVLCVRHHLAQNSFSLVLSCMMPLLPGATLVNSIRDSIEGDYFSSISQISEAISTALMLGLPAAFILANFS